MGYFNPRAPRGARPIRPWPPHVTTRYFNPRAPRGARRDTRGDYRAAAEISIHVPREGHDHGLPQAVQHYYNFNPRAPRGARLTVMIDEEAAGIFQSTCPARGTTVTDLISDLRKIISIHVPREGHDYTRQYRRYHDTNFNPRAPRGARQYTVNKPEVVQTFQSTCPARGTTQANVFAVMMDEISIHVPREGHDVTAPIAPKPTSGFQSTCPARGTTHIIPSKTMTAKFQSTCPARGTTRG